MTDSALSGFGAPSGVPAAAAALHVPTPQTPAANRTASLEPRCNTVRSPQPEGRCASDAPSGDGASFVLYFRAGCCLLFSV